MRKLIQKISSVTLLLITGVTLNAQNVGINATGAAPSGDAMLDIAATNKGLLVPRVNIPNLAAIAPITGGTTTSLLVYNTNATTGLGYYYWDGSAWVKFFTGNPLVDNGLYYNVGADRVRLGGSLVENTSITQGAFALDINLSGTGDFTVQDAGTDVFQIRDDGIAFFGGDTYWRDINITGTNLMSLVDDGDDGRLIIYENGVTSVDLDANSQFVFNEQGLDRNFRIESNTQANMFFVDAGNNRIGVQTGTPSNIFHVTNGGVNIGATGMAFFQNLGADGVSIQGRNTSATSGYNASEFITDYSGTAFLTAGIMGLAIYQGAVNCNSIGVRAATNEWQGTGIYASRFNSGGTNSGWGGQVYNDLGYTGFLGTISDERTKKDIQQIKGALGIIDQLNPVTYHFDLEKYPTMGLNEEMEYGFIAQEVRKVLPEVTRIKGFDPNSCVEIQPNQQIENKTELFVAMDYTRIIPILTKGIQEQQKMIEAQNAKINELEKMVLELKQK